MNIKPILFAGLLALGFLPTAAAAPAGKVTYSIGEVSAVATGGAVRALKRGDAVVAGDRLVTANGRLQIRFMDGGLVALQPGTEFTIDDYAAPAATGGSGRSFFSLLRGGIRAVTGAIGRVNRGNYRVKTSVATIGIRGTTYKARVCNGDCKVADGLYAKGGEGRIVIANGSGEIELGRGERAYVADANSSPARTATDPDVADIPPADGDTIPDTGSSSGFVAGDAVFQEGTVVAVEEVRPLRQGVVAGTGAITFDGQPESGAFLEKGVFKDTSLAELNGSFNADNALVAVSGKNASDQAGAFSITNVAEPQTDGILYLGRWTNGTGSAFADGGFSKEVDLDSEDNVHYITGVDDVTVPGSGSASYTFNGLGTASTGTDGSLGNGITGGTIDVNFGSHLVETDLTIDHGGAIAVQSSGSLNDAGDFATHGSATGAGCGSACAAQVNGFLAGQAAVPERIGAGVLVEQLDRDIVTVGGFTR